MQTTVGYTGGTTPSPTYRSMGDHTESIRVEFDPARISYGRLLEIFWDSHDPATKPWSAQYRAVVFWHDEEQRRLAQESAASVARRLGKPLGTAILPAGPFHPAEDYHQKYRLRGEPTLLREFRGFYPEERRLAASTAAARVNGYLGGWGDASRLATDLPPLGLSETGGRILRETGGRVRDGAACSF